MRLFHLVTPAEWAAVQGTDEHRPPSLAAEGFVHLSFAVQVAGTANRFYRDLPELVALEIDPDAVAGVLRVEDTYGHGATFPHVYGPLPVRAVLAVHPLTRDERGDWTFAQS